MHAYWTILISTLIPTLNIPIYKFKISKYDHYANHYLMIIMQITIWVHLSSSKVILRHNTVVYMYLHSYKINILICNSKYTEYQKKTIIHNSETFKQNAQVIASVTLLSKYYILGREKRGIRRRTWNWRTRCTALCTLHIELYVCILLLVIINC